MSFASAIACSGTGGTPRLSCEAPIASQHGSDEHEPAGHDEERKPRRQGGRERCGQGREEEAEGEEREDTARDKERRSRTERGELLAHLECGQLAFEPNERPCMLDDPVHRSLNTTVADLSAGGHDFASR